MCLHLCVDGVYVWMHPLFLGQMVPKRERIPAQPGVGGLPILSLPGTYSLGSLMCWEWSSRQRMKQAYFYFQPLSPSMKTVRVSPSFQETQKVFQKDS